MSTRKLRQKDGAVYFATFSCHEWVPLFTELQAYYIVYNWMRVAHGMGYLNLRRVSSAIATPRQTSAGTVPHGVEPLRDDPAASKSLRMFKHK